MKFSYDGLQPHAKEFFDSTNTEPTEKNIESLMRFSSKHIHLFWKEIMVYVDEEFIEPSWEYIREQEVKKDEV